MRSNSSTARRRTGLALLLVGVLVVGSVGPALAAPRVFVASAGVEERTAVPGETVDVRFQLRNTGDDGARTIAITANGSQVFADRYQVDTDEIRNVTEQITLEEPGVYQITVDDKRAGKIRVRQTLVETTDVRADGRTMLLRGGRLPYGSVLTTTFPATNESVAIDSVTYETFRNEFNRTVELYTDASTAPISVPTGDQTTVFGAVTVQSRNGIEDRQIRIGVNRSTVEDSSLERDDVHIYSAADGQYVELDTSLVDTEGERDVFEANTSETGTLLVGSLAPVFEVSNYSLSTSEAGGEKRVDVSATVTNTGSSAGNYTGTMFLDDRAVDNETVRIEPGESRSISLSDRLSRDGSYRVSLDEEFIGSVVVETGASDQTATATSETDTERTQTAGETETETSTASSETDPGRSGPEEAGESDRETESPTSPDDGGGFDISLPDGDIGLTEIAIGGSVAVIGVILVLLQRW